jgi:hypothetical protein
MIGAALCFIMAVTACRRSDGIKSFCTSVAQDDRLVDVRLRADSSGGVVRDFPQSAGFLLYERNGGIFGSGMCQVDAKNGLVTRTDFFVD